MMTGLEIVQAARERGLLCGALDMDKARAALSVWREHAEGNRGFRSAEETEEELCGAKTVLILALPYLMFEGYPEGVGHISGYYVASNRAYFAAKELVEALEAGGVSLRQPKRLPLKPLARAAGFGEYGRNGVIVSKERHIVLYCLLLEEEIGGFPEISCEPMDCGTCGRCERACPTGALGGGCVDTSRCLRSYMEGKEAPADIAAKMGDRLLGCDTCLNACPGKERAQMPYEWRELFAWDALLDEERYLVLRPAIAEVIGVNYARTLRDAALRWSERRGQA